MCETCGCMLHPRKQQPLLNTAKLVAPLAVSKHNHTLLHSIMSNNDKQASANRERLKKHTIFCVNLMSSPGAGKTRLLEATIGRMHKQLRIAVIEGDLETENDAIRIRKQGVEAIQITTGSACHLDAHYIEDALNKLDLANLDLIFIENVGNLVCPAAFDLGQHKNIVLLSTTEGDDKPLKYPVMFRKVDGMIISKVELLAFFDDFSLARATKNFQRLANDGDIWSLSAKTGLNMDSWIHWLQTQVEAAQSTHDAIIDLP